MVLFENNPKPHKKELTQRSYTYKFDPVGGRRCRLNQVQCNPFLKRRFDFSVLSEFRTRLLTGESEALLLDKLLERCRGKGLVKAGGKQRTDATRVLAAIRLLNRLELVGESMRAALNELATVAPEWLSQVVPPEWYERYSRRIEDDRLPKSPEKQAAYAQSVGEDGFKLLDLLKGPGAPPQAAQLRSIEALRQVLARHYERLDDLSEGKQPPQVRFKANKELPPAFVVDTKPPGPAIRSI